MDKATKNHRTEWGPMPPRGHDRDPEKSGVIRTIAKKLDCDIPKALKMFNFLRKRRILVFDAASRQWCGCEVIPQEVETRRTRRDIEEMRKQARGFVSIETHEALAAEFRALLSALAANGYLAVDSSESPAG